MLAKWMEKDVDASWEKVIDALESLSQIRLANQLKKKYCTSESNSPATAVGPKQAEPSPERELGKIFLKWKLLEITIFSW